MLQDREEVWISSCAMDHVVYHTEHLHRVSEEKVKVNTTNTISQSTRISLISCRDNYKATDQKIQEGRTIYVGQGRGSECIKN